MIMLLETLELFHLSIRHLSFAAVNKKKLRNPFAGSRSLMV